MGRTRGTRSRRGRGVHRSRLPGLRSHTRKAGSPHGALARDAGERGRIVPEFNDPDRRELFVGNYRLLDRIDSDTVYVIAFVHGARDLAALVSNDAPG